MPNHLLHECSPYLLQHAHNPVEWRPWTDEVWAKAKQKNKLVLVSIGYSACHWCHVMERESFEDEAIAKVMNEHFICIKVDREQRPDVDHIYMTAVQLMTGSGGWPLNCFTLPDGRPIYGGTYFPKENWIKILHTLAGFYKSDPEKVFQYAAELTSAVKNHELVPAFVEKPNFTADILKECTENWKKRFDNTEGGPMKAPKFPLPNNYQFLLRQYYFSSSPLLRERVPGGETGLLKHIELTLEKIAYGGIYDQIGGGFARYSTDSSWKVPHFEKMLYDNAQLVSLYSEAYQFNKNPLYKNIVNETLEFIQREMTSPEGAFYSALDADSEGEEGKYYVWTMEELKSVLGEDMKLFADYYNVNEIGFWEEEDYILLRKQSDEKIARRYGLPVEELQEKITGFKKKLLTIREKRIKPGLDTKILTSWNALMVKGYADAYKVFGEEKYMQAGIKAAEYIHQYLSRSDGGLLHAPSSPPSGLPQTTEGCGRSSSEAPREGSVINGFLEDYCFTIDAFISLYQITFNEKWLDKARSLAVYSIKHFYDASSAMFYFTSDQDTTLIARKMEIQDNVMPSSNSSMALSLFYLGKFYDNREYLEMSGKMLRQVQEEISKFGSAYSNWAMLMQCFLNPFYEIVIVGKDVDEKRRSLSEHYIPNAIFAGTDSPPIKPPPEFHSLPAAVVPKGEKKEQGKLAIPLLEDKYVEGKTLIHVCENKTCKLPTENIEEALGQIAPF
ncbi:MAG: thioredoxin domain-containing protein [Bacteroidetes bacterium]|nr:MAG: thioredoxin domain-containing protein [Bacteroidota bacterium]